MKNKLFSHFRANLSRLLKIFLFKNILDFSQTSSLTTSRQAKVHSFLFINRLIFECFEVPNFCAKIDNLQYLTDNKTEVPQQTLPLDTFDRCNSDGQFSITHIDVVQLKPFIKSTNSFLFPQMLLTSIMITSSLSQITIQL